MYPERKEKEEQKGSVRQLQQHGVQPERISILAALAFAPKLH
jgi:hypothetical protein